MGLTLIDDGTMDTVLECSACGKQVRYSEADRDEHGCVEDAWISEAEDEHYDECQPSARRALAEAVNALRAGGGTDEHIYAETLVRLREALPDPDDLELAAQVALELAHPDRADAENLADVLRRLVEALQ